MRYQPHQLQVLESPLSAKIFLEGPAGTGKTTTGIGRLSFLIESGVPAHTILLLLPQRTLASPYLKMLESPSSPAGTTTVPTTFGGIARRMIALFWPKLIEQGIFDPDSGPPTFLTLESTQYFMARLVQPLMENQAFFDSVTMQRNRIYSQIIDNLNKAAVVGFPHQEIGERLKLAWVGDPGQTRIYEDAQYCANAFRDYCYQHALLDFSLQTELFTRVLWPSPEAKAHLTAKYDHLIADNLEEDAPVFHDLLEDWLPAFDSSLLIYDSEAGYRKFLGADPTSGKRFLSDESKNFYFSDSFVTPENLITLSNSLTHSILSTAPPPDNKLPVPVEDYFQIGYSHFYPDMLYWTAENIKDLITSGCPPSEIAVLAPYLGASLRFSLMQLLTKSEIPVTTHRPSRSLRDEPITRALLTASTLAHPDFSLSPSAHEIAHSFLQFFPQLGLIRAHLLAKAAYDAKPSGFHLRGFDQLPSDLKARITYLGGSRYQLFFDWLQNYLDSSPLPLDHFLRQLFGEVLSQPGFGFHDSAQAGAVTAKLVESVHKFRQSVSGIDLQDEISLGREYLIMVKEGVIASQYIEEWKSPGEDAVFLAPAYTFLMNNNPVDYQFWLDGGSRGWYERIYQPLTHPHVLSRDWPHGKSWTDDQEMDLHKETLNRLVSGLINRCQKKVYLGFTASDQRGYDQKGLLLQAINRVFIHQFKKPVSLEFNS